MRLRKPLVIVTLALAVTLVMCASCRTLVRVVDEAGSPMRDASVRPVWLSVSGEVSITDVDGYARLHDGWSLFGTPRWVFINATERFWQIDYPPPEVIRLDPGKALPLPSGASQQGHAAGRPQTAGG